MIMPSCQPYILILIFPLYIINPENMLISTHHNELSCKNTMSRLTGKMPLAATASNTMSDNPEQSSITIPMTDTHLKCSSKGLSTYSVK